MSEKAKKKEQVTSPSPRTRVKRKREKDMSPEAKRKRRIKALIITGSIVGVFVLFIVAVAIGNAVVAKTLVKHAKSFDKVVYEEQLHPVIEEDGYYSFTTDDDFKVVHITDLHIGGGLFSITTDKRVLNAVAAMVTAEKPDLVIATGDITYPVVFAAGTADNIKGAKAFAELMEKLEVYWTCTFGNHDTEAYSKYGREYIADFYIKYEYCLLQKGPSELAGFGNSIIKIKNTEGYIERALVTIDSHAYTDDDKWGLKWHYENITEGQIEWYKEEMLRLKEENTALLIEEIKLNDLEYEKYKNIPSSLYFHIPLREYKEAWLDHQAYTSIGQETERVQLHYGRIGEGKKLVYHGIGEDNMFATMAEVGGDTTFCGHDHLNNISISYKPDDSMTQPIRLTYGLSMDYLAYVGIAKKGSQRGCTVVVYSGQGYEITPENYYQDKYPSKYKKEKVTIVESEVPKYK